MKKLLLHFAFVTIAAVGLTSCYSASVLVGDCNPEEPMTKVYTKHNTHLIDGLANINTDFKASESVGEYAGYKVNHSITFVDGLLRGITMGIYTPSTTKVYVPTRFLRQGYQQQGYQQQGYQQQNYQQPNYNQRGNQPQSQPNGTAFYHTVKQGETIQSIASSYGVSVRDIVTWNHLNSNNVEVGSQLQIILQ